MTSKGWEDLVFIWTFVAFLQNLPTRIFVCENCEVWMEAEIPLGAFLYTTHISTYHIQGTIWLKYDVYTILYVDLNERISNYTKYFSKVIPFHCNLYFHIEAILLICLKNKFHLGDNIFLNMCGKHFSKIW